MSCTDHVNFLRKYIAAEDEVNSTHDLRLCAVEVFESVLHSNDTKEQMLQKLNELNELYLADKDTYNEADASNMEFVMMTFAEFIDRPPETN